LIAAYLETRTAEYVLAHAFDCVTDLAPDHTLAIVSNTDDSERHRGWRENFGLARSPSDDLRSRSSAAAPEFVAAILQLVQRRTPTGAWNRPGSGHSLEEG
jgi:hypothetical protein